MESFPLAISYAIGSLSSLCEVILSMVCPRVLGADLSPDMLCPPWSPALLKLHPSGRISCNIFYIYLVIYLVVGMCDSVYV